VEGTIEQLFEGHHINYIECINVDYKSNRKESFYGRTCNLNCVCILCAISIYYLMVTYAGLADLQLDVKGCRDVYASFDKYVEVERLEGDNKYQAEQHGLQVPTNHVLIMALNLNLKLHYLCC
jgi:ubiquitin carboxyl-terminal hydrolase 7